VKSDDYWTRACRQLTDRDPVLASLIQTHDGDRLRGSGDAFRTLINAIVGQQISVAAAESIWKRINTLSPELTADSLLLCTDEALRSTGLSRRKVEYIRGISRAFVDGTVDPARWETLSDHEVHANLRALRGVGPWTADMMLIFHLHRPDVLPLEDIGLVNGATRLYRWEKTMGLKERAALLRDHAERWKPWRTVATWYIWRDIDAEPVIY
jgi:DNA-3-methyladenine glycosylase II